MYIALQDQHIVRHRCVISPKAAYFSNEYIRISSLTNTVTQSQSQGRKCYFLLSCFFRPCYFPRYLPKKARILHSNYEHNDYNSPDCHFVGSDWGPILGNGTKL